MGLMDGYREASFSWMELLSDCKQRGLITGPKLAIGDGGLGFWAAIRSISRDKRTTLLGSQDHEHPG